WARYPADLPHNLVLAHTSCNARKRDFLAYPRHVERWRTSHLDRAAELAERCKEENLARLALDPRLREIKEEGPRYGAEYLARARLGQGAFRVLVTDAYQKRCAISGERTLPVLQAAHIRPYAAAGPHRVSNGLLLRSDLHILFDRGYVTVTP